MVGKSLWQERAGFQWKNNFRNDSKWFRGFRSVEKTEISSGLARVKALTKKASLPFLFFDYRTRL
jgi:hypothetical protein